MELSIMTETKITNIDVSLSPIDGPERDREELPYN